jgi:2,3-dihydroxybenzoate-AMP ligase
MLEHWTPYQTHLAREYEEKGYWQPDVFSVIFDRMADRYWDREALVGGAQRFTYGQIKEGSDRLALHFIKLGLKHQERVMVQLTNIPEFVFLYLAFQKIGVIPVMCLDRLRYGEMSQIAKNAGASAFVTIGKTPKFDYTELVDKIADEMNMRYKFVAGLGAEVSPGYISINDLLDKDPEIREPERVLKSRLPDPHDVCILLLSGGTTGVPKLIPREYNAYRYVAEESSRELGYNMYTVQLAVAPVAHNMVLAAPGIQGAYTFGGKVIMSTSAKTEDICKLIEKERITHIPMVPAMVINMLNFPDRKKYDLSSWQIVINGGSKIEPNVAVRVEPEIGCKLLSQFGMSEGTITQTSLLDTDEVNCNTIGLPVSPADEWRVVNKDTGEIICESAPPQFGFYKGRVEEEGELQFRGPYTIRGYYNAPEHNKKAFTEDGFYRSGDLGCMHKSGRGFVIMGRIKDAINRGGEKFSCEEVENIILKLEKVHDCALVPMPDPILGEKACCFVSLRDPDKDTLTLAEITEFLDGKLAKFKFPERLEIRRELPLTNVGKILKDKLRREIYAIMEEEKKTKN